MKGKRGLSLCLIIALALLASINLSKPTAYGASATLQAADSISGNNVIRLNLFDSFTLNMTIKGVTDMAGYDFKFYWNATVLNCTGYRSSPPYVSPFEAMNNVTIWSRNSTGRYWLTVVSLSGGSTGDFVVAQLDFSVIGAGQSVLSFSDVVLGDSLAQPIPCTPISGSFATIISDIAVVNAIPKSPTAKIGSTVEVDVEVQNRGNVLASSTISVFFGRVVNSSIGNLSLISAQTLTDLAVGESQNLVYEWNTAGVEQGNYSLYANATRMDGEFNVANNEVFGGFVDLATGEKHDVAVLQFAANSTILVEGETARLTIDLKNQGWTNEGNFTLNVYSNNSLLYTQQVTDISVGRTRRYLYNWSTSGLSGHYNFVANITISDIDLFNNQKTLLLVVTKAPIAAFTISPTAPSAYQEVTFDASASTDPSGSVENMNYTWDFGDSTYLGHGKIVTHWYSEPGNYTVKLTLTDETGLTYVSSRPLTNSSQTQHEVTIKATSAPIISGDMLTLAAVIVIIIEVLALAFVVIKRKPRT